MRYREILEACWKGYRKDGMKTMFGKRYPNCVKVKKQSEDVAEGQIQYGVLDHANVNLIIDKSESKPDGVYSFRGILFKVKGGKVTHYATDGKILQAMGRFNTQIGSYATNAEAKSILKGVKEGVAETEQLAEKCWDGYQQQGMKKKGDRQVPNCVAREDVSEQAMEEDLKKWFKDKWVRFGPDGKIRGDCARGSSKEGKPKCLPKSKAQSMGKKGRASAAARKRRQDPNPNRSGAAKNVATKKK